MNRLTLIGALLLWSASVASGQSRADTLHLRDAVSRLDQIRRSSNNSNGVKDMATKAIAAESAYFRLKAPMPIPPNPTPTPPPPTAALGVSCVFLSCAFNASGSTGTHITYAWDCGAIPNCVGTTPAITFKYPHEGPRTTKVTVTDSLGRIAAASKTFDVAAPPDTISPPLPPDTVTPPVPPDTNTIAARAELPRAIPNPTFAPATRVVSIGAGGNLQAALDSSKSGDEIRLAGGATYTGNFIVPPRPCGAGITLTSAATLPPAGSRMTPTLAAGLAKIVTPNSAPALKTINPTCGWRFLGLEIIGTLAQTSLNYGIFWLGDGGWKDGGENQVSLAQVPRDIVLDRVYLHGTATLNSTRCLFLNSGNTVIRDSWISDCHASGFDSQAILGCNGPGPYLIDNNDLEGAGESVMFGGCDPADSTLIPADITFRRNHVVKNPAWKSAGWTVKNCFELKNARRVLIEANVFGAPCTWVAAQVGMAIVIKSSTETCAACTWEGSKDVTVRWNSFDGAHRGLNIQAIDGSSAGTTASHTERVTVENNRFTNIGTSNGIAPSDGWLMLLTHDLKDIVIGHNTFVSNTDGYGLASYFSYSGGAARRIDISDNVYAGRSYYALASDGGNHTAALTAFAGTSWRFGGNAVASVDQQFWANNPTGNAYLTSVSQLGLLPDGSLPAGSPYAGKGADIAELTRRTTGVVVAP